MDKTPPTHPITLPLGWMSKDSVVDYGGDYPGLFEPTAKRIQFNAGYSRNGFIWRNKDAICDGCRKKTKNCLAIDSSEGEYGPGVICIECINVILYQD